MIRTLRPLLLFEISRPSPWRRRGAIGAQAFAIVAVLVGLFTIAVGVGSQTVPDVVYHLSILAVLGRGPGDRGAGGAASLGDRHG